MSETKRFIARKGYEPEKAQEANPLACAAWGCPLKGSIDVGGGGKFLCHCHAKAPADRWQSVTNAIRDHDWLLGLMADLRRDDLRKEWREYAAKFWEPAEPELMSPNSDESRDLYTYRMHLELEFRVGARVTRPGPALPQGRDWPTRGVPGSMAAALPEMAA